MELFVQLICLAAGLALILFGASWLVEGSTSIARKTGLSEFVIGLTIVGIGTSAPEMVVSFISAFQGKSEMAIGNILGSNIFNVLMILGITALVSPLVITRQNRKRDIPLNICVTILLLILGMKRSLFGVGFDEISRWDGALMLAIFVFYMWRSFKRGAGENTDEEGGVQILSTGLAITFICVGLLALVGGGRLFVNSATAVAQHFNLSEKFIAITIMSAGTSLPELATCIVAAQKGRGQMALGNILGSNISNILLILGGSALIHPLSFAGITLTDMGVVIASALLLMLTAFTFKKDRLDRTEGVIFIIIEIGYMAWLMINA